MWLSKMCKDLRMCKLWKAVVFFHLLYFQFCWFFLVFFLSVFIKEGRESYPKVKLFI